MLRLGVAHMKSGKHDKAELVFREILRQRPETPDALHMLGMNAARSAAPGTESREKRHASSSFFIEPAV